jgi:PEP-CTERM motif
MARSLRTAVTSVAMLLAFGASTHALAAMFDVTIDTSAIMGSSGKVTLDYTVNNPPSFQHVGIFGFVTNGTSAGLPESEGGLVEGTLILPPFTAGFAEIGGSFFFNELIVNLVFGTAISFELHVPDLASDPGGVPDQFALFLLDSSYMPLFPTSDPTGADALFVVDITGQPGGLPMAFSPATLVGGDVDIVVPGGLVSPIPEPATLFLLLLGVGVLAGYRWRMPSN